MTDLKALREVLASKSQADEISIGLLQEFYAVLDGYEKLSVDNADLRSSHMSILDEVDEKQGPPCYTEDDYAAGWHDAVEDIREQLRMRIDEQPGVLSQFQQRQILEKRCENLEVLAEERYQRIQQLEGQLKFAEAQSTRDDEVPPFESDPVAIALNLTPMPANASYDLDRQVECLRRGLRIKQLDDELESANKAASTYLEGLTKRIGELEEALEPFAKAWNQWSAEEHALIGPDMYVDDPFRKLEQAAKAFKGE